MADFNEYNDSRINDTPSDERGTQAVEETAQDVTETGSGADAAAGTGSAGTYADYGNAQMDTDNCNAMTDADTGNAKMDADAGNTEAGKDKAAESPSASGAQASKSRVEEVLGTAGAEVALDLKDLFTGMFTAPVETLRENARRKDHASSYIIAAVLSVFVFIVIAIMGDNPLVNQAIGRGTLVVFSLTAAVAIFVFKAIYAACVTFWGRKYNPELTYSSALGTFCLLGIYDIIMLLAFTFFTAMSIFELSIAILFFWLIVTAISGTVASWVLTDGKAESVIRFNLVLLFIFIVLTVLSLRGIVIEMCAGALMVIMNTLAGF